MHTKQFYEAPEAEMIFVKIEKRLLDGSPQWSRQANDPGFIENEDEDRVYGF